MEEQGLDLPFGLRTHAAHSFLELLQLLVYS